MLVLRWGKEEVQNKTAFRDKSLDKVLRLTVFNAMPYGYEREFINKIAKYQTEYEVTVRIKKK